jgi:hypothetical protein
VKLDRFRMLEGERPAGSPEPVPHAPKVSDRFGAVDAPKAEPELGLDPRDARGQRTHIRCIECAHENGRYDEVCHKCHATLLTRAVRRMNMRLHQDEQAVEIAHEKAVPIPEPIEHAPAEQKSLLDHVAGKLAFGSLMLRRAIVVAAISGVFGLLYLATGWHIVGFAFALIATLGLFLVVT